MPTAADPERRRVFRIGSRGRSRRHVVLASLLAAATCLGLAAGPARAAQPAPVSAAADVPEFAEQVLYQAGTDGYSCFRIPAIVTTNDGTLLAFAEGRVRTCSDTGDIDLVLRRSHDGGRTWGPLQVLVQGNGDTRGNPVPIVDRKSGRIVLLSTYNPGENQQIRHPFVQYSEDDGATWTAPRDLTAQISRPEWEWWYGTGPVHGIQLRRGPHAGRMVAPAYFNEPGGSPGGVVLALSDDGGLTWRRGAVDRRDSQTMIPGENTVVELTDGRIYDSAREGGADPDPGNRAYAISSDGGETFDAPFVTDPRIEVPTVQGALLRLSATDEGDARNRLLFAAPAHPAAREVMTVRSSYDEAASWDTWEQGKVIHWGPSAYSDLTELSPGVIGLLYEAGGFSPYEEIRFARMNEAYLDTPNGTRPGIPGPPAPGPTTPNLATGDRSAVDRATAFVRGGASLTSGRFGKALNLDGVDDRVEVPYDRSIDLGAGDFTWSTWFRYTATSGTHTLGWAYRLGPNTTPQVWFRAEPGSNRLRALLGTGFGTATLTASGAHNDGEWHQVVLQRVGRRFLMWVDGAQVAAANSPSGSVTEGKEFGVQGIHVGERVDGTSRFHGSLDEVRVYRRALAPAEITRLYEHNLSGRRGLALWLPFERIDPN
ncbi:sialidase family protein [Actinopolymorpha rutila]|uniref:exo-alpha-sialidase n=1 Tax=Actinopolymorpha rutila TaxID=446787 RepID=A0A852ZAS1_9ACTN|nr:sialidase family protein [Actinopolymorpha rutila]NYH90151.1 sialidase-1 [Actinopolymorpha rutila]